jgi:type II secretory pathway component GspD/PulD (secretin)
MEKLFEKLPYDDLEVIKFSHLLSGAIVLGGIYENTKTENKKEVPFFSKIPLLGLLFRSYVESDTMNELLVFITPTIVKTD